MAQPVQKPAFLKRFMSTTRVNQVTFLSKVLAAILFIMLPFVGFVIGFTAAGGLLPIGI